MSERFKWTAMCGTCMSIDSKYLTFTRITLSGRKTPIIQVRSKSSGIRLGTIAWFGRWRQFCFYPYPETVFNSGCMSDIQAQIAELMEERK
jgi:hypothetical protein